MKRIWILTVSAAVLPVAVLAGGGGLVTSALSQVPAVPQNAQVAYALYSDANGALSKGRGLKDAEATLVKAQQEIQLQMASFQMQMAAGPVSDHDQALVKSIGPFPKAMALHTEIAQATPAIGKVRAAYDTDVAKIDAAQSTEISKLPVCPGEAGEPSEIAVDKVKLKYADQRIALASAYLPRYDQVILNLHQSIAGEAAYADHVHAAWASLQSPMMKSVLLPQGSGVQASALADVAVLLSAVEDVSEPAAQVVANKNKLARDAAKARGC